MNEEVWEISADAALMQAEFSDPSTLAKFMPSLLLKLIKADTLSGYVEKKYTETDNL